jgi:hypothetical protein
MSAGRLGYYRPGAGADIETPPGVACFCEHCTPPRGFVFVPFSAAAAEMWNENEMCDVCDGCGVAGVRAVCETAPTTTGTGNGGAV